MKTTHLDSSMNKIKYWNCYCVRKLGMPTHIHAHHYIKVTHMCHCTHTHMPALWVMARTLVRMCPYGTGDLGVICSHVAMM